MGSYKIDFTTMPWETPLAGLRCKTERRDGRQLRLVEYSRDMTPHWCERGHIGYILDGQFEIRFENETLIFNPGDGVFIPPGPAHRHMARVLSDTVRVVFVEES
jgi:ethanolamine utilization protein EutQ (cupin superfamily)